VYVCLYDCRLAAAERAEGDKVTRVKAAEAEAEARYLQGLGISRQRQAILNGLRDSVADFSGVPCVCSEKGLLHAHWYIYLGLWNLYALARDSLPPH
jgi:hypothetical protein